MSSRYNDAISDAVATLMPDSRDGAPDNATIYHEIPLIPSFTLANFIATSRTWIASSTDPCFFKQSDFRR